MSKTNGEKARAAIQRRNRTARREKDRARLAEIRAGGDKAGGAETLQSAAPAAEK
jgi:hypothetical protein